MPQNNPEVDVTSLIDDSEGSEVDVMSLIEESPSKKKAPTSSQDSSTPLKQESKPLEKPTTPTTNQGVLNNIYSKYPGLKVLGNVTLKADTNFNAKSTGAGSIEYFSPTQDSVRYGTGLTVPHPKLGTHGILYNPKENGEQAIMLDMLHGMKAASPQYATQRENLKQVLLKNFSGDINGEWNSLSKEEQSDGKEQFVDNWVDGIVRNLMFEGTPEEMKKAKYWDKAKEIYLKDPKAQEAFNGLKQVLKQSPTTNLSPSSLLLSNSADEGKFLGGAALPEKQVPDDPKLQQHVLTLKAAQEHPIFQPDQSEIASKQFVNDNPAIVGTAFLQKGDTDNANTQFDVAIQKNPNDVKALIGKGYIASNNDDNDAAIKYFQDAANQNDGGATMLLAGAQLKKATKAPLEGKIDLKGSRDLLNESLKNIDAVIASNPDDLEAHVIKAKVLESLGMKDEATAERKLSSNLFLKQDHGVDANDNAKLAASIGNGISNIAGTAVAHFLNPPEFLNQVAQGVLEGNKDMSDGATQMNEANKTGNFKDYTAGTLKQLKGAMNMGFSAMMGVFPESGYTIMQSMNAADELTNGEASKIVFAPLQSVLKPTSDIGQSMAAFGDAGIGLIEFGIAHKIISGNLADAKKTESALTKLKNKESLTVEETQRLHDEIKTNLNPVTVQRILDAVDKLPNDVSKTVAQKAVPLIAEKKTLEEQKQALESEKGKVDESFHPAIDEKIKTVDNSIEAIKQDIAETIKSEGLKTREKLGLPLGEPATEQPFQKPESTIFSNVPEPTTEPTRVEKIKQSEKENSGVTVEKPTTTLSPEELNNPPKTEKAEETGVVKSEAGKPIEISPQPKTTGLEGEFIPPYKGFDKPEDLLSLKKGDDILFEHNGKYYAGKLVEDAHKTSDIVKGDAAKDGFIPQMIPRVKIDRGIEGQPPLSKRMNEVFPIDNIEVKSPKETPPIELTNEGDTVKGEKQFVSNGETKIEETPPTPQTGIVEEGKGDVDLKGDITESTYIPNHYDNAKRYTGLKEGDIIEVPIHDLMPRLGGELGTADAKSKTDAPINVDVLNSGVLQITDGHNRFKKALLNGDKTVKVKVEKTGGHDIYSNWIDRLNERAISEGRSKPEVKQQKPIVQQTEVPKTIPEKTARQLATEARKAAKEKLNATRNKQGISDNPEERAQALFDYHKALVVEAKEYIKEGIKTVEDFAEAIGEKVTIAIKKAWDEANGKNEIKEPAELGYSDSEVDFAQSGKPKALANRLVDTKKTPEDARQGIKDEGLTYEPKSQEEAQQLANSIIDEVGIDEATLRARSQEFGGDVNTLVQTESLNRLAELSEKEPDFQKKFEYDKQFADTSIKLDEWLRKQGRGISAVNFFYKKSPLGVVIAENVKRGADFKEWSKPKEKSWKDFYDELIKEPEFDAIIKEQVKEGMKQERAESRKARIEKVDKFFDDAKKEFQGSGALYSTVIPPKVIVAALEGMKKAYHAGEKVSAVIQQAVDYISEKLGTSAWDSEKFRKEWEERLAEKVGTEKKPLTDEELKAKVLDKFRKKLKGLSEKQKDDVIRKAHKQLIENGALDFEDFKGIISRVVGRGELTAEEAARMKELVAKTNQLEAIGKNAREDRTPESYEKFKTAQIQTAKAARELNDLFYNKPDITKRLTSIMQLNTLGIPALINNPIYNIWNQMTLRFPVGLINDAVDRGISGVAKLMGKNYVKEYNVLQTQNDFWKMVGVGGKEALDQIRTGLNRADYTQKEIYSEQIRPFKSARDLMAYKRGERNYTPRQLLDKALQATVGIPAEAVARLLNLGDKPQRFAAGGAQASAFAKALGLTGIDKTLFNEFPREEAYREYKRQGLSDEVAGQKADYIRDVIVKEGQRSTFQQDNLLNDAINAFFGKFTGGKDTGASQLAKTLAVSPYIKIPSNAFWSMYNLLNPEVAITQAMVYGARSKHFANIGEVSKSKLQLREARYWAAHAMVGMASRAVVIALVKNSAFTPATTQKDSKKEKDAVSYFDRSGVFHINGMDISAKWYGQWGMLANQIGRKYQDATPEQRENQDEFWNIVFGGMEKEGLAELSNGVFANSSSILQMLDGGDPTYYLTNTLNLATNIVQPAALAQISRATLDEVPTSKGDTFLNTLNQNYAKRSILYRKIFNVNIDAKRDIWGQTIPEKGNMLMRMFAISKANPQIFGRPLYNDFLRTNDTGFLPPAVYPTLNGKDLNKEQYDKLQEYVGAARKRLVEPYVNDAAQIAGDDSFYSKLTDEEKKKKLSTVYDLGRDQGVEKFYQDYPELRPKPKKKKATPDERLNNQRTTSSTPRGN